MNEAPEKDLSDLLRPAPPGWQWVVLHTKPRCEKKIQLMGRMKEAVTYLPTLRRVHNYGARVRHFDVPMFTGYVFSMIRSDDKTWFRQNPYVANLMEVAREASLLGPLRAIASSLAAGQELEVLDYLQPGKPVRITGGPMKGLEAVIAEVRGKDKIILHLELIQQSVVLEISAAYVKPVL